MTVVAPARPALASTTHPLQSCGAWAVAVLAGRSDPGDVTPEDLDTVAAALVDDIVERAKLLADRTVPDPARGQQHPHRAGGRATRPYPDHRHP
ncbi:hypothetical protein [Micromonospora sp. RTGN7]|uniref:hypothetical protein n=1 Tax=Micromonospora sp. RTGN7 TaxID=3016526 RepID=UPI0029FF1F98|nr:hypothetical protein [Micromonospora sp. RTGN7]